MHKIRRERKRNKGHRQDRHQPKQHMRPLKRNLLFFWKTEWPYKFWTGQKPKYLRRQSNEIWKFWKRHGYFSSKYNYPVRKKWTKLAGNSPSRLQHFNYSTIGVECGKRIIQSFTERVFSQYTIKMEEEWIWQSQCCEYRNLNPIAMDQMFSPSGTLMIPVVTPAVTSPTILRFHW